MAYMNQPIWYSLSHHDRYRRFRIVRSKWCRRHVRKNEDVSGRTIDLDGTWIDDIPSFYMSLGEAINGPNGYFGGCLDSLDDCLCGTFGVVPPLTVRLSHFDAVRNALDGAAWCRWRAESAQIVGADYEGIEELVDCGYFGDGSDADIARWTAIYEAALAEEPFDCDGIDSYFDGIVRVFKQRGAELVSANEDAI